MTDDISKAAATMGRKGGKASTPAKSAAAKARPNLGLAEGRKKLASLTPDPKTKQERRKTMKDTIKKNIVVVDPDNPWNNVCDVREYTDDDAAALAAGRIFAHDLPLSGEWQEIRDYEWGDQLVACFARWNKAAGRVQIAKVHGPAEDLRLDSLGNLWEYHWNDAADKWDRRLVG